MEHDVALLLCTAPDEAVARTLAHGLVNERLAACVSILPGIRSTYRWQGKVEQADEVQIIAKTTRFRAEAAISYVKSMHPYELPEVLVVHADDGSEAYLEWVERETTPGPS